MEIFTLRDVIMIGTILFASAGVLAVMRHMVKDHLLRLNSHAKRFKEHEERLNRHGDDLVRLNTLAASAVTADDVREEYVSKELFRQYEEKIDQHFESIERSQEEILKAVRKNYGS